jgi:predicted nucleotidyltransferase
MVDRILFIIPFGFHYLSPMNSNMLDLIASYFQEKAPIRRAWIFGSHARGTQSPTSDIDIQIQVYQNTPFTLFDLAGIQHDLSQLLALEVDLVMLGAPLKSITKNLNHDKILIYENPSPKLERKDRAHSPSH